jgi:hypothetical protein
MGSEQQQLSDAKNAPYYLFKKNEMGRNISEQNS